jgi:hypothetical protein
MQGTRTDRDGQRGAQQGLVTATRDQPRIHASEVLDVPSVPVIRSKRGIEGTGRGAMTVRRVP